MHYSHENVQLLCGNFYARFFLGENLVLAGNTTKILLPVGILTGIQEDGILGGFLAEMRSGNFSWEGSCRENWPPWQDPSECWDSWRDPTGIPVPILQGINLEKYFRELCWQEWQIQAEMKRSSQDDSKGNNRTLS